jgi:hypothetical protein
MIFDQVGTKSEFKKKIDRNLDQRLADNRTILVRALDQGHLQVGKARPQMGRSKMARNPPPITKMSVVMGLRLSKSGSLALCR